MILIGFGFAALYSMRFLNINVKRTRDVVTDIVVDNDGIIVEENLACID